MSPFSYDKIPFGIKASNISAVANFSSTLDDSYILVIANNCNTPVYNNANSYDIVYNSFENAALYGANRIAGPNNENYHEAYIGIRSHDTIKKIAQFNKTNTTISANILPFSDSAYNIGTATNKWNNIHATKLYGDGANLTNVNITGNNADSLQDGTGNRFIVNNNFEGNLNVNGTLSACNLVIEGDTTVLNTTLYSTERFEIINNNSGPAFKVTQTGYKDILQIFKDDASVLNIDAKGNTGVKNAQPSYDLDISGTTRSSTFLGDGSNLFNVNLSDKSTRYLREDPDGSNLYFTPARVGVICEASNIHTSNYIANVNNEFDGKFDRRLLTKTLDNIPNGTSNKCIVNDVYQGSMRVTQTLTAYDLNVTNSYFINNFVQQNIGQASRTEIINVGAGPALKIVQNDPNKEYDVLQAYVGTQIALSIISNGNVGINKMTPAYNLDVEGTIRGTYLRGNGENITNVNLTDKSTRHLIEDPDGNNLYFTPARVATICNASNIHSSNFTNKTSNLLATQIISYDTNTCNYIDHTCNLLATHITTNEINTCNYVKYTCNMLATQILTNETNTCNYIDYTCNLLATQIITNETNTCNYIDYTCNLLATQIISNDTNTCNYIDYTCNLLATQIATNESNTCNYIDYTCNLLATHITTNETNTCNYINHTCNLLATQIISNETNTCNYIDYTCNLLATHITTNETNTCNYIDYTCNLLATQILTNETNTCNYIEYTCNLLATQILINETNTCNYLKTTSNYLLGEILNNAENIRTVTTALTNITLNDIGQGTRRKYIQDNNYDGNLNINGILSACNLVIEGDTTVLNTTLYTTERFEVVNANMGPAFKVTQTGAQDILQIFKGTESIFRINTNGNIGVRIINPQFTFDISGTMNATNLRGDGSLISSVNLSDKNTRHLAEDPNGTNLYYTPQRVGVIATASNIRTSNYVASIYNILSADIVKSYNDAVTYTNTSVKQTANTLTAQINLNYNLITANVTRLDALMSNYVRDSSNELANIIKNRDAVTSNYIAGTSNVIAMQVLLNEYNTCNFISISSNAITNHLIHAIHNTCNYVSSTSNSITSHLSQEQLNISNIISNRITQLTTDHIAQGANNLYYTDDRFDKSILTKTLDHISQGTSNRFITNNNFKGNLNVEGTLSACNLIIEADRTVLNTTVYQTEKFELVNHGIGPAFKITQTNVQNILEVYNDANIVFKINDVGNIGVKTSEPLYDFHVNGTAYSKKFKGDGEWITNVNLTDKTSDHLREGSNLYYTADRASTIVVASNIHTSNYVDLTSNQVSRHILANETNTCNYINTTSNAILKRVLANETNTCNYILQSYNYVSTYTTTYDTNISNYVNDTSNLITRQLIGNDTNISNYVRDTSNLLARYINTTSNNIQLFIATTSNNIISFVQTTSNLIAQNILSNDANVSNFVSMTSNKILIQLIRDIKDTSNYVLQTSNNLAQYIYVRDSNQSNYVLSTSNIISINLRNADNNQSNYARFLHTNLNINLTNVISNSNLNVSNYILNTSNIIYNIIYAVNSNQSNYVLTTSNAIINRMNTLNINQSNYTAMTSNVISTLVNLYNLNQSNFVLIRDNRQSNYVLSTNNILTNIINRNDSNQSNYVASVNTRLQNTINTNDRNQSNYVVLTRIRIDNKIIELQQEDVNIRNSISDFNNSVTTLRNTVNTNNVNISNYVTSVNNRLTSRITDTSNFVMSYVVAEIKNNSNILSNRITETSNFVMSYVVTEINNNSLATKTLDHLRNGTSNKYITNNAYNNDLFVRGTLTASNLIVSGDTTTLNTTTYQTEKLEIVSSSFGPALKIQQFGNHDILSLYDDTTIVFKVADGGNIGIFNDNPQYNLDVHGTTFSSYYVGDGRQLYNVNLADRSTSHISEGSNLYFTTARVENIVSPANIQTSNFIVSIQGRLLESTNLLANELIDLSSTLHEIIENNSNNLASADYDNRELLVNTCNILLADIMQTSNALAGQTANVFAQLYTYANDTCNLIFYMKEDYSNINENQHNIFMDKITTTSMQVLDTCNMLLSYIQDNDAELKREIDVTSNILNQSVLLLQSQIDTIIDETSEIRTDLSNTIDILTNTSNNLYNYYQNTEYHISNIIYNEFKDTLQSNLYNAIKDDVSVDIRIASNILITLYNNFHDTSNALYSELLNNIQMDIQDIFDVSNYINSLTTDDIGYGIHNRYIIDDIYDRDVTFTQSVSTASVITKSMINFGGIDIYNNQYNTPSIFIRHENDTDVLNIGVNNVPKLVMNNSGYVGVNTNSPEFDMDVRGILHATRLSGDGGLVTHVNLSDRTTDDLLEGQYNLYFREEKLNELIMSKSIDMFQPGSNMSIIRNGIYYGSLLVAGQLTVNSLKILDVNAAYISSNASNYGNGIFEDTGVAVGIISNLDYDIKYVSNMLINTIDQLHYTRINSLDQVGNGTSNRFIVNDVYYAPLQVMGIMQAEYVAGDGMFITNINLLDKTTDDLSEGSRLYYTDERAQNYIYNISADYLRNGMSNQYIVNGVYEGDLIITGDLTVSRVQILDIFANVLNSNYEPNYYQSSNSYVQSLASFIKNVNAGLTNDLRQLDNKLNLIMTCNMDETILGMLANDSNMLLNKFSETINYVNQNVSNINIDIYRNISNLIDYVNENVSRVDINYHYSLDGSNLDYVMSILNTSNQVFENKVDERIKSLTTNNIKEGINLYFTPKRAGAICYASNLHVSNYVHVVDANVSNYINMNANMLANKINALTLDDIALGSNNTYIRDNVYEGYLIVTGGIITNNVVIRDIEDISSNATQILSASSNIKLYNRIQEVENQNRLLMERLNHQERQLYELSSNFNIIMSLLAQQS